MDKRNDEGVVDKEHDVCDGGGFDRGDDVGVIDHDVLNFPAAHFLFNLKFFLVCQVHLTMI